MDLRCCAAARNALRACPGVGQLLEGDALAEAGVDHPRSGQLVLVAEPGSWFAYPWWTESREAPDFATHVDIHNKPGYDPCELFFGWPPMSVSMNTARIKGSHGRPDAPVAWTSTLDLPNPPRNILDLATAVRAWCQG